MKTVYWIYISLGSDGLEKPYYTNMAKDKAFTEFKNALKSGVPVIETEIEGLKYLIQTKNIEYVSEMEPTEEY